MAVIQNQIQCQFNFDLHDHTLTDSYALI